jgi:hypothetical protein
MMFAFSDYSGSMSFAQITLSPPQLIRVYNIVSSSATVLLHGRAVGGGGPGEAEDLRVPTASPFGLGHMRAGINHKDFGAGAAHGSSMGSALLVSPKSD